MALDGITLSKVKEEISDLLPIRINRISESSKTEIIFNVHAGGKRTNLVMSFHSVYNHICLSNKNYSTYLEPSTFVMVLRKYILNGIIYDIEQNSYDRFLLMKIRARNELYDEKEYLLSVELMGKYANLILVDQETGKIIDALKKIPPFENTRRTILSGAIFTLPEPQDKKDPYGNDVNLDESLVKQLAGFSKQLEKEVRYRISIGQQYEDVIKEIKESDSLYLTKIDDSYEYSIIPLLSLERPYEKWPIFEGFDELYFHSDEKERIKNISDDLFKVVKRQIKHFENKIGKLNESLHDAINLSSDLESGELLYTYSNLDDKGLKEVEVVDYEGNSRIIKLDPKLSIKENANKYYQIYQKKRKGKVYIEEQLAIASNSLEYFNSLNEQLSYANYEDALDIKEELAKYGYLKKKTSHKAKKKKKISLYQLEVDGYLITFGKNNIQNSYLSFDYAKPNNLWFHAHDYHGSHVVVNSDNPPEKIMRICANIAAYYSKGRYSSSVPVDYLPVKQLKKVKGMPPGFVTFHSHKTIYIDPYDDKELEIRTL